LQSKRGIMIASTTNSFMGRFYPPMYLKSPPPLTTNMTPNAPSSSSLTTTPSRCAVVLVAIAPAPPPPTPIPTFGGRWQLVARHNVATLNSLTILSYCLPCPPPLPWLQCAPSPMLCPLGRGSPKPQQPQNPKLITFTITCPSVHFAPNPSSRIFVCGSQPMTQ
jgi:hypothetical protein